MIGADLYKVANSGVLKRVEAEEEAARCGDWGSVVDMLRHLLPAVDDSKPQQW